MHQLSSQTLTPPTPHAFHLRWGKAKSIVVVKADCTWVPPVLTPCTAPGGASITPTPPAPVVTLHANCGYDGGWVLMAIQGALEGLRGQDRLRLA